MNNSIYMMLAVPYCSVLIVGFMIYRGVKKNQEYLQAQAEKEKLGEESPRRPEAGG